MTTVQINEKGVNMTRKQMVKLIKMKKTVLEGCEMEPDNLASMYYSFYNCNGAMDVPVDNL